jgi:hypothetical protein
MPILFSIRRHTARTHFVAFPLAMGLGTFVEPAYAQLSTGCQDIKGTSNHSSSHSRPFLLNNHYTWKAGNIIGAAMPRRALVIGAVLMILRVFSRLSFAAPDWNTTPLGDSVATSVWATGMALSSDGRYVYGTNTSQVEGSI